MAEARADLTLMAPTDIDRVAWLPLEGFEGVEYKLLWRSGKSVAGILRVPPGRAVDRHIHRRSHHHMWVLDGSAEIIGRRVTAGTYMHIPAGAEHGILAVGADGCTVLYLYLRQEDQVP